MKDWSLRFIDVKGLATVGFYTPELDDVFVDVSLAYRAPHQIGESLLAQPPAEVASRTTNVLGGLDPSSPKSSWLLYQCHGDNER